jgi:O-antigen ligase
MECPHRRGEAQEIRARSADLLFEFWVGSFARAEDLDVALLEEDGVPAVFDRYSNSFLKIYFDLPESKAERDTIAVLIAILLANAVVLIPQSVVDRVNSTFKGEGDAPPEGELDASAEARLLFWRIAWDNFKERPMGLGTGTFPTLVEPYWKRPMNAHNVYLQLLTEYGLQGLFGLIVLIGSAFGYFYKTFVRWDGSDRSDTALSLLGWWTAHCAAHFFVNPFFLMQGAGQFWIMAACLPHLLNTVPEPASKVRPAGGRA